MAHPMTPNPTEGLNPGLEAPNPSSNTLAGIAQVVMGEDLTKKLTAWTLQNPRLSEEIDQGKPVTLTFRGRENTGTELTPSRRVDLEKATTGDGRMFEFVDVSFDFSGLQTKSTTRIYQPARGSADWHARHLEVVTDPEFNMPLESEVFDEPTYATVREMFRALRALKRAA